MDKLDKLNGMFIGGFLGDALGAPFEFRRSISVSMYRGVLEHSVILPRQWHEDLKFPAGTFTDDSLMTLAMIKSIVENNNYIKDDVTLKYMEFANNTSMLGRNTRAILKGVKTLGGYKNRTKKISPTNESNGPLMRASPLAIFSNFLTWTEDVSITNISQANYISNIIYVQALRYAIDGHTKDEIMTLAETLSSQYGNQDIILAIQQAKSGIKRNLDERIQIDGKNRSNKGWVVHGIYSAFWALYNFNNLKDGIDSVILLGGDTDTNAKIAGDLMGAYYGYTEMMKDETNVYNAKLIFQINKLDTFNTDIQKLSQLYQTV